MRIGILADIHGNSEALAAIPRSFDELWVLGDLVNYGPDPCAVVDFLRRNAAVIVRGNHDHAVGAGEDPGCSAAFRAMALEMQRYTESVLTLDDREFLRGLPATATRVVDGRRFFLCHAAPSSPLHLYAPPDPAFWKSEANTVDADVLLVGHTHLPLELALGGKTVVNPGSVGQPKHGVAAACYAVWEGGRLHLESSPYDVDKTVGKVRSLPIDPAVRSRLASVLSYGGLTAAGA